MILNCHHCSTRVELDDATPRARESSVRCANCGVAIETELFVLDAGDSGGDFAEGLLDLSETIGDAEMSRAPRTDAGTQRENTSAVAYDAPRPSPSSAEADSDEMMRRLAQLLSDAIVANNSRGAGGDGARWGGSAGKSAEAKLVLVCVPPEQRETIARIFDARGHEVFVATDAGEAIKVMREDRPEIVVLAPEFDPVEQGALFVTREISALRMPERRRVFVIQVAQSARTADAHAAFVNSVNLVVNTAEPDRLSAAFDRAARDHKELYLEFNKSLDRAAR